MAESFYHNKQPEDPFDALVSALQADDEYATSINALNSELATAEQQAVVDEHPGLYEPTRPNYTTPINHVGQTIYNKFVELCTVYGIDVNQPEQNPEVFDDVQAELALFVYGLKHDLWLGDMLGATDALLIDMGRDEGDEDGVDVVDMSVVSLSGDETVIGSFAGPVIGPMPDEMSALTLGEFGDPPIGVGLLLEHPIIIEGSGETHANAFEGTAVIVALGTMGLNLHTITYQDDLER